jgi:hypothetical protein
LLTEVARDLLPKLGEECGLPIAYRDQVTLPEDIAVDS